MNFRVVTILLIALGALREGARGCFFIIFAEAAAMVEPVSSDLLAAHRAGSIPSPRWQAAVGAAVVLVAAGMALEL